MNYLKNEQKRQIKGLQKSIKQTIALLGWSLKDFVGKYMIETHDHVEEEDINQFYETIKKQIERDSTNRELLVKYHSFLFSTDEYKKLRSLADNTSNSRPLKNIDTVPFIPSSKLYEEEEEEILNSAINYAEMMGSCWDFTLIKNDLVKGYDAPLYLVIYQCDFGFNGGSGCYGTGLIEILSNRSGSNGFFIADKKCEIDCGSARFSHVIGMKNGELIIAARDFDSLDCQSEQTMYAEIILARNAANSNKWEVKSKEYVHKDLLTDLNKLESGFI